MQGQGFSQAQQYIIKQQLLLLQAAISWVMGAEIEASTQTS